MSGPEGTQARRPLRTVGVALLGLAVAAALIGLLVLPTGDDTTTAGERPTGSSAAPSADATAPRSSVPLPSPSSAPLPSPGPAAAPSPGPAPAPSPSPPVVPPSADAPAPVAPPGPQPVTVPRDSDVAYSGKGTGRGEVRVYNNGTIRGLAAKAADDLSAAGWTVVEVDNYSAGRIPTTTVYYQEGTDQRAIADAIGTEFGMRVEPRFPGIAHASPGVIVIVTDNYGS